MRIDEKRWATTLVKVYRHMKIMERTKYLEPHFTHFIVPIVKYAITKFKLGGGDNSAISSHYS